MSNTFKNTLLLIVFLGLCSCSAPQTLSEAELPLALGDNAVAMSAELSLELKGDGSLLVNVQARSAMPFIRISAPNGSWDLSRFQYVTLEVENRGSEETLVVCRINGLRWIDGAAVVTPGKTRAMNALLTRNSPPPHLKGKLYGMNGLPGGYVRGLDELVISSDCQ